MISPIKKGTQISFPYGQDRIKDLKRIDEISPIQTHRATDVLELENGDVVVISSKAEDGQIKDKVMTLWDNDTHKVRTLLSNQSGENPMVYAILEKGTHKLDKLV